MQVTTGPFSGTVPCNEVTDVREDCLTLNVWTPDGDVSGLPVLLWIYGVAFLIGGTSIETYDGALLAAEQEIVVVSANYRVGALGFLWLGDHGGELIDATANCGLLDQLAAAKWVQANVAAFGGDGANVTVFGESAGAGSLVHLMTSARSTGAFRRFICQSAGIDFTLTPDRAAIVTAGVFARLGMKPSDVPQLLELPAETLIEAQEHVVLEMLGIVGSMPFHPVIDGDLIPKKPAVAVSEGAGRDVDLLMSWTADELRLFPEMRANDLDRAGMVRWVQRYLTMRSGDDVATERAAALVDFYAQRLKGTSRNTGADLWAALQTDGGMRLPARRFAAEHARSGGLTYVSQFDWEAGGEPWHRGAFHAIDLPFAFGTINRGDWRAFLGADEGADRVSQAIRTAWANFARTGDPSDGAADDWKPYGDGSRTMMRFNDPARVTGDPLDDLDEVWAGLWSPEGHAGALMVD